MERFFDDIEYRVTDLREYSTVTLAYIGDSVYELYVRSFLLKDTNKTSHELHRAAVRYVSAKNQARILESISGGLDEEERNIVRRARNKKAMSLPRNALLADYKQATALEALIGYLYIKNDRKRLQEILRMAVEAGQG